MKELITDAKVDNLDEVLIFVDEQLEEVGCSMSNQIVIDTVIEEIFVNIAYYAYGGQAGPATVQTEITHDMVELTFIDNGEQYDPLAKPDPDLKIPFSQRKPGGLGIFIVKKSMDEVKYEYRDGKNILYLKKSLV